MPNPTVTYARVFEDGGSSFMARVVGNAATNITQASISAIACSVFDIKAGGAAVATPTVTVSATVFDTLQTDGRWTIDTTGYNFRHDMPATTFTTGGKVYGVEYKFTPTSGEVFWLRYDVTSIPVNTS